MLDDLFSAFEDHEPEGDKPEPPYQQAGKLRASWATAEDIINLPGMNDRIKEWFNLELDRRMSELFGYERTMRNLKRMSYHDPYPEEIE